MAEGEEEVADDGEESLDEIATRKPSPTRALRSFLRRSARRRRERLSASAAPDAWICTASTAIATTTTDTQVRHGWAGLRVHLTRVSNVSSREVRGSTRRASLAPVPPTHSMHGVMVRWSRLWEDMGSEQRARVAQQNWASYTTTRSQRPRGASWRVCDTVQGRGRSSHQGDVDFSSVQTALPRAPGCLWRFQRRLAHTHAWPSHNRSLSQAHICPCPKLQQ